MENNLLIFIIVLISYIWIIIQWVIIIKLRKRLAPYETIYSGPYIIEDRKTIEKVRILKIGYDFEKKYWEEIKKRMSLKMGSYLLKKNFIKFEETGTHNPKEFILIASLNVVIDKNKEE